MALNIGDKAPDFEAETDSGEKFHLKDHLGKGAVVLYFYPKDNTPGCTAEACSFRDNWERLTPYNVEIFGISSDDHDSHVRFKSKYNLPFTLLSDPGKKIRKLYDATGVLIPPRITYVIDSEGMIRHVYNSQLKPASHVDEVISALKKMKMEKNETA